MADIVDDEQGNSPFEIEHDRILPGELNEDRQAREAFGSLSSVLASRISHLKEGYPGKNYFHSSFEYEEPLDGGAEVTIVCNPDSTRTTYEWRQGVERHNLDEYASRGFSRFEISQHAETGTQQVKLEFRRDGRKHLWKAKSDKEGTIAFHSIDINSADLLPIIDDVVINLETLLDPEESNIEAQDETPPSNGLAVIPKPQDKARWN